MEESHPRGSDIPGAGAGEGRKQVEGLGAAAGKKGVVLREKTPPTAGLGGWADLAGLVFGGCG